MSKTLLWAQMLYFNVTTGLKKKFNLKLFKRIQTIFFFSEKPKILIFLKIVTVLKYSKDKNDYF